MARDPGDGTCVTETRVDTGLPAIADHWYRFDIVRDGSTVTFTVTDLDSVGDLTSQVSISDDCVPALPTTVGIHYEAVSNANLDSDYFAICFKDLDRSIGTPTLP